jgi:hypothetical protein
MSFQDFLVKYNGKYIDTDGAYGPQCMDEMHQYCVEVLGISDPAVLAAPCAADVWNTFQTVTGHDLFEQIGNTPTGVPQEGDIMLWTNAPYGHVAIFVEGDANSFRSFDQNYPTGSPCHIQNHVNYNSVGGWLRFKGQVIQNNQALIDQLRADRDKNWQLYEQERQHTIDQEQIIQDKQKTIDNLTKENLDDKQTISTLTSEKQAVVDQYTASQAQILASNSSLQSCKTELSVANGLLANRKDLYTWSWKERFASLFKKA